jgi:hypothetical protein
LAVFFIEPVSRNRDEAQRRNDMNHEEQVACGDAIHEHKHVVKLRIQTPRGLWNMHEPKDTQKRPEYHVTTKIERVIADARSVFHFVEQDSKYTLLRHKEVLDPQRTLESYRIIEDGTLLVLSVQGGNA